MTDIVLVEDHASFRQAIAFLLDREDSLRVVAQVGTLAEAGRLPADEIDLAVVDLHLPDGNGTEFVEDLRKLNPRSIVLVLTASIDSEEMGRAVDAGATQVVRKSAGVAEIVEAVKRLVAGQAPSV